MNNFKNPTKKLSLLVLLFAIAFLAVSCGKVKTADISNAGDTYFSVKEGELEYKITKGEVYSELKGSYGLNTLLKLIDIDLLKAEKNNNVSYYDLPTEEEIAKAIEDATFPDGKEDLSADEIKEAQEEFTSTMYKSYGYLTEQQIKDHYRFDLAKTAYAKARLDAEITAIGGVKEYFTSAQVKTYYTANYITDYYAIVLPYISVKQYTTALEQVNVVINDGVWVNKTTNANLTTAEIVQAYIDLYNIMYGFKNENYPAERRVLLPGTDEAYTFDNGIYSFNLDEESLLHYTKSQLTSLNSVLANNVVEKMDKYSATATTDGSWYTAKPLALESGKLYYFVLNIAAVEPLAQDDVEAEILDKLTKDALTDAYKEEQMAILRKNNNIRIYDVAMQTSYVSRINSYSVDYEQTENGHDTILATVASKDYTPDQVFAEMDKTQGPALAVAQIMKRRLAMNPSFNPYYDYSTGKWLDKTKQEQFKKQVASEKEAFNKGNYTQYGYDPKTIKWKDFLSEVYGAANEEALSLLFLEDALVTDYANSLKNLTTKENGEYVVTKDDELWKKIETIMQEQLSEYFNATGMHLLICAYETPIAEAKGASGLDPEKWTEKQRELATELYSQIKTYIDNNVDKDLKDDEKAKEITKVFENIVKEFAKSPYEPLNSNTVTYSYGNIEVSKFKSAGLSVKYESLGTFANGSMVESFNDAVKAYWDENPDSTTVKVFDEVIKTSFGYHLYVNTKTTPLTQWEATLEFQINEDETKIQYRYVSEIEWKDLNVQLPSTLEKGKNVLFRTQGDKVQWHYSDETTWTDLATFEELGIEKTIKGTIPTLGIVRRYVDSSIYSTLTETMKNAYTKYFDPIYKEVGGSYYPSIIQLQTLKGLQINLHGNTNYTLDNVNYVIDMYITEYNKNLTYLNE